MIKVKIYGLAPKDKSNQSVVLYDKNSSSITQAAKLSSGEPDESGTYSCSISKNLVSDTIIVSVIFNDSEYLEIRETVTVDSLGVYHAVKLERETNVQSSRKKWPVDNESSWYSTAVINAKKDHRSARYKNWTLTVFSAIATVLGVGGGLIFANNIGLYVGGVCAIFCVFSAKYASGQEKGI
jgi:hypothetical protein